MPGVDEAAAFAIPDPVLGEAVALVIHGNTGQMPDQAHVCAFIAQRLAGYKVPARVYSQAEPLPRNATGKVLKSALKERWKHLDF